MTDGKIHVPARKREVTNKSEVVRVSAEAYNVLIEIYNESALSMAEIASLLITEGADMIVYDKED